MAGVVVSNVCMVGGELYGGRAMCGSIGLHDNRCMGRGSCDNKISVDKFCELLGRETDSVVKFCHTKEELKFMAVRGRVNVVVKVHKNGTIQSIKRQALAKIKEAVASAVVKSTPLSIDSNQIIKVTSLCPLNKQ